MAVPCGSNTLLYFLNLIVMWRFYNSYMSYIYIWTYMFYKSLYVYIFFNSVHKHSTYNRLFSGFHFGVVSTIFFFYKKRLNFTQTSLHRPQATLCNKLYACVWCGEGGIICNNAALFNTHLNTLHTKTDEGTQVICIHFTEPKKRTIFLRSASESDSLAVTQRKRSLKD